MIALPLAFYDFRPPAIQVDRDEEGYVELNVRLEPHKIVHTVVLPPVVGTDAPPDERLRYLEAVNAAMTGRNVEECKAIEAAAIDRYELEAER